MKYELRAKKFEEILQRNNINNGEFDSTQDIVVSVVGDNVPCITYNSTIDELVVIWICSNEVETEMRGEMFDVFAFNYRTQYIVSRFLASKPLKYFSVFLQNLVGNAQCILSIKDGQPYWMIGTSLRNALNKGVGVENYAHRCQTASSMFFCSRNHA